MRVAIAATVAWTIYANVDAARMAPTSGTFIGASVLVTVIWVVIFLKGITYLNQPSLRAENLTMRSNERAGINKEYLDSSVKKIASP